MSYITNISRFRSDGTRDLLTPAPTQKLTLVVVCRKHYEQGMQLYNTKWERIYYKEQDVCTHKQCCDITELSQDIRKKRT